MFDARQAGEGKFGTVVSLLFLAALVLAAWNVVPVYYNNYSFADRVVELARAPRYNHSDERIMDLLMRSAEEHHLEDFVNTRTCSVKTMETRRTIICAYDRPVQILPGVKHTFRFKNEADQPLL
ncbi:MAG TPA: hypothetical protein VII13_14140 [Vicinamibacteria bacterium]|jgi:hypothetical protein